MKAQLLFKENTHEHNSKTLLLVKNLSLAKIGNIYVLVFSLLIFSSKASYISESDFLLTVVALYSITLNLLGPRSQSFFPLLCKITIILLGAIFLYYFKKNDLDIYTWIGLYVRILMAFSTVFYCGRVFEEYLIRIVYYLCLVSIPLFFIQLINFNSLHKINNIFGLGSIRGLSPNSNSLIFNLIDIHSNRNCGFMWEPGAFAAIILFTLILSLRISRRFDKVKFICTFALLTTFSTLGYISFFLIIFYFYYKNLKKYLLLLIIPVYLLFINLDFIINKITNQISNVEEELYSTKSSNEHIIHLNRFATFYADYNTFLNNPFLGLGVDVYSVGKKELYKDYDENVVRTSGLMSLVIKVGLLGTFLLILLLFNRVKKKYNDFTYSLFFVFIYIIVLFSNPLDFSCILLTFLFL